MLNGLATESSRRLPFRSTTDLQEAVEGADFVLCAIRVGLLEGRVIDESVPLSQGVLGQETTGPGGICFALRTIPAMTRIAEAVAEHAPDAWFINFTNPAGMVTEAVQRVLGDRAIGICDSPAGLCRRVAAALGREPDELWFDYFGLNHLGWLKGVRDGERDLLPDLLDDDERLRGFEEGRLFGGEWLRSLGMVPNEYLYYFYYAAETVDAVRHSERSRGAYLLAQQREFYAQDGQSSEQALARWRATRHDRERTYMAEARLAAGDDADHEIAGNSGYESEAMAVMEAIALNTRATLILNTANRSSLPFLDERAVVEVPNTVGKAGPVPIASASGAHSRPSARRDHEGRRAAHDRGRAHWVERSGDSGARPPSAGALGPHRARDLRRVPGPPARAAGGVQLMGVDLVCGTSAFLDLTFPGARGPAGARRGALRGGSRRLARRRRNIGDRGGAPRPQRGARGAARARLRRSADPRRARRRGDRLGG